MQKINAHHWRIATQAVVAALLLTITTVAPVGAATAQSTQRAAGPDTGWQSATPAAQGMDATTLQGACDYALQPQRHTQGVVVIRGGKLVDECYANGEGPRSWAASWSVGKSFASTLVGIAIAQGKIPSLDVSMATFFPEWAGTPKAAMTLRDVVTMSSGLQWNEDYDPSNTGASDVIQMGLSSDELEYAKTRPLIHTPGTRWAYSSGDAMLLSGVIQKATGMSAGDYAQQVLFAPLGITQVEWWKDAAGHTLTFCCLDMPSRDFARLGLLFMNHGNWGGHQIVPAQWVTDAFTPVADSNEQYGFMWWMFTMDGVDGRIYMANGFDGQMIFVIPSLDLVVVRNGDYVKSKCPAIADPVLFGRYPPSNLVPGQGTRPPEDWSDTDFLQPIIDSVTGPSSGQDVFPANEPDPGSRFPDGQTTAPCKDDTPPPTSTPTTPPASNTEPVAAVAVKAQPTFTG